MRTSARLSRLRNASIPCRAAFALIALVSLAWGIPGFGGESGDARRNAQDSSGAKSGAAQSTQSPPAPPAAPGPAVVYVYRHGRMLGAIGHPTVFVNHERLAELDNSDYARVEVPAGPVSVIASGVHLGHVNFDSAPPPGAWASLPGCAALDWRGILWAPAGDRLLCGTSLNQFWDQCAVKVEQSGYVRITHVPGCHDELKNAKAAAKRLNLANFALQVGFEAEPGHTYYVRYMITMSGQIPNELVRVDEAAGAKEVKGMHLAKH